MDHKTNIISNVLNYDDDMSILQQGSIESIRRNFEKIEKKQHTTQIGDTLTKQINEKINKTNKTDTATISINSIEKFIAIVLALILCIMIRDFLTSE